jgi:hypothetical protein
MIGHFLRMDQVRTVQKIPESKLEGSRRGGTLRLRRQADVEDLQEIKVKRWRQKAVDREE